MDGIRIYYTYGGEGIKARHRSSPLGRDGHTAAEAVNVLVRVREAHPDVRDIRIIRVRSETITEAQLQELARGTPSTD